MTSMITARVDAEKRKSAEEVFSEIGLTTSGAVNLFICAVAMTGGIPFPVTTKRDQARYGRSHRTRTNRRAGTPSGGIKIGLADNRFQFHDDFDAAFDAMDSEVAGLFG